MADKRAYTRYSTSKLKASYYVEEKKEEWKACSIVNVSRKGLGIRFHTQEGIDEGSLITIQIDVLNESKSLNVRGIVEWIWGKGDVLLGGIELIGFFSEMDWVNFLYFMS
jgi:hypothetical protein